MPELFPSVTVFVLCGLVVACAQMIYATVGFGAGMFSIALLAMLLPDLAGAVAALLLLTLVTEVWVLFHVWREGQVRLLLGLLPTTVVGMWLGTELLKAGDAAALKRLLGLVVMAAGAWFLHQEVARAGGVEDQASGTQVGDHRRRYGKAWTALPAGLASGVLAGLFGTGGPPIIVFLKGYGLGKGSFRATLLCYFLLMSALRAGGYVQVGLLSGSEVAAALWLLPASMLGTFLGMAAHRRLPEVVFGRLVSVLLVILGGLLVVVGGS